MCYITDGHQTTMRTFIAGANNGLMTVRQVFADLR